MSDLSVNTTKFKPDAVGQEMREVIDAIRSMPRDDPWWEVGMPEYRRRAAAGKLSYKPRLLNDRAQGLVLPSREKDRAIRCRLFTPASYEPLKGIMLHIHGGGYSVFSSAFQDPFLAHIADTSCLGVVSVEYRLAPEHPFPQGPEDCYDVAEWLAANSMLHYGAELSFIAGSSTGAHFAALTALNLRKVLPDVHLRGLVLLYGMYDLTYSHPSIVNAPKNAIICTPDALKYTTEAFVPGTSLVERRDPSISPFYADLQSMSPLPPALFVCGTEDILIDESVFFGTKWMMVNSETVLKIFSGALHGFIDFEGMPFMQEGWKAVTDFLAAHAT